MFRIIEKKLVNCSLVVCSPNFMKIYTSRFELSSYISPNSWLSPLFLCGISVFLSAFLQDGVPGFETHTIRLISANFAFCLPSKRSTIRSWLDE